MSELSDKDFKAAIQKLMEKTDILSKETEIIKREPKNGEALVNIHKVLVIQDK